MPLEFQTNLTGLQPNPLSSDRSHQQQQPPPPVIGEIHTLQSGTTTLTTIRGLEQDYRLSFAKVIEGSTCDQQQLAQLKDIWLKARLDPRSDEGTMLQALLPTLLENRDLLTKLHAVATSDHLFGRNNSEMSQQEFDTMRREFLAELIRGAVDTTHITQGPGAMCTAATMLKMLPHSEFLRLACDYALDGGAITASGKPMEMRDTFWSRAITGSTANIGDIRCRRPSAGMLMVLDGVIELGVPNTVAQSGAYWYQYTEAWRALRGCESACAGRDAQIYMNASGQAVRNQEMGSVTLNQMDYLQRRLQHAPVLIDTRWNHSSPTGHGGMDAQHGRHMLVAEQMVTHRGETYFLCENPIGDFVDTSKSYKGHAEYFPSGTILGNKNGFWFETAANGMVLIRKDVLEKHLETVLVDYHDAYTYGSSNTGPIGLGTLTADKLITFVDGDTAARHAAAIPSAIEVVEGVSAMLQVSAERPEEKRVDGARLGGRRTLRRRGKDDEDVAGWDDMEAAAVNGSNPTIGAVSRALGYGNNNQSPFFVNTTAASHVATDLQNPPTTTMMGPDVISISTTTVNASAVPESATGFVASSTYGGPTPTRNSTNPTATDQTTPPSAGRSTLLTKSLFGD